MSDNLESRVTSLEKDTAVLNERTQNQGALIAEIKTCIADINAKLDAAMKRPPYTVVVVIALLSSASVGLLVFAVSK